MSKLISYSTEARTKLLSGIDLRRPHARHVRRRTFGRVEAIVPRTGMELPREPELALGFCRRGEPVIAEFRIVPGADHILRLVFHRTGEIDACGVDVRSAALAVDELRENPRVVAATQRAAGERQAAFADQREAPVLIAGW